MLTSFRNFYAISLIFLANAGIALAGESVSPVVAGLHQKHPLNEVQQGAVLMAELRCAACHDGLDASQMKMAPDLREAGSRLTFEAMQKFIANPAKFHPGSTMPQMLAGETNEKREEISRAISHYLLSISKSAVDLSPLPDEAHDGFERFHSLGCVACHPPRDQAGKEIAPEGYASLAHVADKYQPRALAAFLYEPLKIRPGGRMPDMNLNPYDAEALAAYLMADKKAHAEAKASPQLAEQGAKHFRAYNCVSCHQLGDDFKAPLPGAPPSRAKMKLDQGCLSDAPGKAPDFSLNDKQRQAIRAALTQHTDLAVADRLKMKLTQLNCISCHQRDDYGGVVASRDAFFHSKEEALGNESRIPPPLTGVGGKLRVDWLNRLLYDRERSRPYMITRMPHYGEVALRDLTEWLAEMDRMKPVVVPEPDNEKRNQLRDAGLQLLGDKGLNCIACHNYNGTESPGMKGIDLMTSYQRLTPEWFFAYMKNPASFRPGIIMPSYWPEGKALQTEVLNGDTESQLQALWYTFSLGRSARDPSGLKQSDIRLAVKDKAVVHRGRSRIAGYRGVAVGLPGGLNYAFNAQNGSLAAIWFGDFVSVNWKSQGAGDFHPIGKYASLPQDVSFLPQATAPASWPLLPVTTKESPVNPDPTYPRAHGYSFGGYTLDENDIPTFHYRSGEVTITDVIRPHPMVPSSAPSQTLRRELIFSTEKETSLVFRVLTGPITASGAGIYQTKELKLFFSASAEIRPFAGRDGAQELLLPLSLKKGTTTLTLDYTPLP
ncbi:MAG: hypothetical protein RI957_677 [Verrucomicrobiota bacterium]|jgi:mono/diheme cytochrome c family protein